MFAKLDSARGARHDRFVKMISRTRRRGSGGSDGSAGRQGGPGLAKTRGKWMVTVRETVLARTDDAILEKLFDGADTLSEGAIRNEASGSVWYGSTSFVLTFSTGSPEQNAFVAQVAARDVHVRLRAIRAACREATLRAPGPLGRSECAIRFDVDSRGLRIDVDVQAPLIVAGRKSRSSADRG